MAQKSAEFLADPECPEHDDEQRLLEFPPDRSWDDQNEIHKKKEAVDIVLEALKGLEERMFEYSQAAGIAGNKQWGLDPGPHQDDWSPFITLHSQDGYKPYIEGVFDLKCSRNYCDDQVDMPVRPPPPTSEDSRPRPWLQVKRRKRL
ncbi:hypothetical protein C8J56DRAFT_1051611 [Mycena floridula]|nr:hypothetical protein C8J56DRAFT_1051611 [Mycena floridula]